MLFKLIIDKEKLRIFSNDFYAIDPNVKQTPLFLLCERSARVLSACQSKNVV